MINLIQPNTTVVNLNYNAGYESFTSRLHMDIPKPLNKIVFDESREIFIEKFGRPKSIKVSFVKEDTKESTLKTISREKKSPLCLFPNLNLLSKRVFTVDSLVSTINVYKLKSLTQEERDFYFNHAIVGLPNFGLSKRTVTSFDLDLIFGKPNEGCCKFAVMDLEPEVSAVHTDRKLYFPSFKLLRKKEFKTETFFN